MTLKSKFSIAASVSLLLIVGLCLLVLLRPEREERPEDDGVAPQKMLAVEEQPEAVSGKEKATDPLPASSQVEDPRLQPGWEPDGEGWLVLGRVVREEEAGQPPADGVTILLTHHPRKTKPEDAPPPRRLTTGADGRFVFPGVTGRVSLRLEIDEPRSAFRALSFKLGEPQGDAVRDLGDIPLEPAMDLVVQLVGPGGEPAEKGRVLVGREDNARASALSGLGFRDSRRDAEEIGGGKYVVSRSGAGPHTIEAMAPGCAGAKATAVLPRDEPLVIQLEEGRRLAGRVQSMDEKPLAKAVVEVHSGPNLLEPDPQTLTDAQGSFQFDILSDGEYEVSATAEGYTSERKRKVPSGTENLQYFLAPEAVFAGKVVMEDGEAPVAKATVTLAGLQGARFTAETDAKGLFRVRKVSAGTYTIMADHREHASLEEGPREIKEAERIEGQILKLPSGIAASGNVVDSQRSVPVADAQVAFQLIVLKADSGGPKSVRRSARSRADGGFTVKGLIEGEYNVTATSKAFLPGPPQSVVIESAGKEGIVISLDRGASIAGRVLDREGKPLAGATVRPTITMTSPRDWNEGMNRLYNLSARTDAEGRYALEGLTAHKAYVVTASHSEYSNASVKGIELGPRDAVEDVDVVLGRGGTIRGRVLDVKGKGISGANVDAREEKTQEEQALMFFDDGRNTRSSATDSDGAYSLSRLAPGKYTVRAQAKGQMPASRKEIQIMEGQTVEGVDLVLGGGETLSGRVLDSEGSPIAGANVNVQAGDRDGAQVETDADGKFRFSGVTAGELNVQAWKQGYQSANRRASVPGSEVLLTLERSAVITGSLRAKGQPQFQDVQAMAMLQEGAGGMRGPYWQSRGGPDGTFEIEVGPGTYVVQASARGFAPAKSSAITVKAGERHEGIMIDLTAGGKIRGVVVAAATGAPISGASVSLVEEGRQPWQAYWPAQGSGGSSGADGTFLLEGVPGGSATIAAAHAEYAEARVTGISVRPDEISQVRVEMSQGGGIRGVLTRAGAADQGVQVIASKIATGGVPVSKGATTDAQGAFEIKGLPPGDYTVHLMRPQGRGGFSAASSRTVTVLDGQMTDMTIAEGAGVRVFGRVTSAGVPVRSGKLSTILASRGGPAGDARIDGSGGYSLDLPGAGSYMVLLEIQGRGSRTNLTVPPGVAELRHDIEIPAGEVAGVVVDAATGEPIPRAQVFAFAAGASRSFASLLQGMQGMAHADDSGRFGIAGLSPGVYTLHASVDGYANGRLAGVKVDDRPGAREYRIDVDRGIPFAARVVSREDQPVGGATAVLRDAAGELVFLARPVQSDGEGLLHFVGLSPASYRITVVHPGYAPSRAVVHAAEDAGAPSITLEPGGRLVVEVADRRGQPVEGATIEMLDDAGENVLDDVIFARMMSGAPALATGPDGRLSLDQAPAGRFRLSAYTDAARSRDERVTVKEGQSASVRLTLSE